MKIIPNPLPIQLCDMTVQYEGWRENYTKYYYKNKKKTYKLCLIFQKNIPSIETKYKCFLLNLAYLSHPTEHHCRTKSTVVFLTSVSISTLWTLFLTLITLSANYQMSFWKLKQRHKLMNNGVVPPSQAQREDHRYLVTS